MAAAAPRRKPRSAGRPARKALARGAAGPTAAAEAKRAASLRKANRARRRISALKADIRHGRIGPAALLVDPRAQGVRIITLLPTIPRCGLGTTLDALLACKINGARCCGDLSAPERRALVAALHKTGSGIVSPASAMSSQPEGFDRELDHVLSVSPADAVVEFAPSAFAAARAGLETDPLQLRMIDRLVDAVRFYVQHDDGGTRARIVAEQWLRYRRYRAKVASGEYPPPSQRGPALLE